MARALAKKPETSTTLLEAAKKVLRQNGYAGLVDARRGCGGRRAAEPDPLSLRLQAGDGAGAVRVSQRPAARPPERAVRRPDAQAFGAMGPGLRLSRRRHRLGLRARAAGADRGQLGRRRGRQSRPRRPHGLVRPHHGARAQGRARARRPGPVHARGGRRPRRPTRSSARKATICSACEKKGVPVRQALRRVGDLIRIAEGGSSKR